MATKKGSKSKLQGGGKNAIPKGGLKNKGNHEYRSLTDNGMSKKKPY